MGKEEQRIIAVKKDVLFSADYFEGFRSVEGIDYESRILKNMQIVRRGSTDESANHPGGNAELNPQLKQPVGYTIVANVSEGKVFAYQRASKAEDYSEKRLQGKWSWGFGGHIEPFDAEDGNPIRNSMLREVTKEELRIMGDVKGFKVLGYVNEDAQHYDDTKQGRISIGRVHFGVLYLLDTNATQVMPNKESTIVVAKTLSELEELCSSPGVEVEGWSKIALEALRKIL